MTIQVAQVLSDEFAEYSGKIVALHEKKKELATEFRKLYEEHKAAVKAIDDEAGQLTGDFESWQKGEKDESE